MTYVDRNDVRRRTLKVYVTEKEADIIAELAASVGLSVAAYLRNLGLGYTPRSVIDAKMVEEMAKINAAQSRLGNLVKLALSNPEKQGLYGDLGVAKELKRLTVGINQLQDELLAVVEQIKF